ncbi:alginate lyase family protein [Ruegeria arenilitoris]|uniref:alginate lyase family protein n=1 Tax=Ruegeria arenilitoris TaxID=1173585 RepID=UPI0014810535|nr:alginate lyase family protein [Ruegeria arenilitoris]
MNTKVRTEAKKTALSLEERIRRKKRRNLILILLSPVLVLLSPVLLPIYFVHRAAHKGSVARQRSKPSMGQIAGSLKSVAPAAKDEAEEERVNSLPDTFALCRVIGNDLVPRHRAGQSLANVKFILENEPDFENCTKLWILNRIFDPENEAKLVALLDEHQQVYEKIPYDAEELQATGYHFETFENPLVFSDGTLDSVDEETRARMITQAYRAKNNYVMNNNGARNAALELCLRHAKWALPFDGNCYFTKSAWNSFRDDVVANRDKRYFTVPMARMQDNAELLEDGTTFNATEEPQMAFRCDAPLRFDEKHPYGRRPKVELFVHLGIDGPWQKWPVEFFDTPPRKVSPEGHRVAQAGWVARLFSGQSGLEKEDTKSFKNRGLARNDAIRATLDMLEARKVTENLSGHGQFFYDPARLEALSAKNDDPDYVALRSAADEAMTRGPYSVTDKPEPAPSGDPHDYYHPAPYWWPNPKKKDGLPYIRQDGKRVPGTQLYEADSDRYDRTRLQRLFDDTTALALAARVTGEKKYSDKAENLILTWFVDPETRMNPNLNYAQVRRGHRSDRGEAHGLIETKDFYFFLDAVRLLEDDLLARELKTWLSAFLEWLTTSEQGIDECGATNNHGSCFDLQVASIAAFLDDVQALQEINLRAQARLLGTITPNGEQPFEMERTLTQHYCTFNLQSWINLFNLLENVGFRPWSSAAGERLISAMNRLLSESEAGWSHPQIDPFNMARLFPIDSALRERTGEGTWATEDAPFCYFPHDGVAPFWRQASGYKVSH